ncbi:hypothetical protein V501_03520, partial [Pseudogymnoascus sp. VKM F-4519 (FW-2642)]
SGRPATVGVAAGGFGGVVAGAGAGTGLHVAALGQAPEEPEHAGRTADGEDEPHAVEGHCGGGGGGWMGTVSAGRMIWVKKVRGGDLEDQEGEDGGMGRLVRRFMEKNRNGKDGGWTKDSDLGEDRGEEQERRKMEERQKEEELGDGPHDHGGQDPPSWEKELENRGAKSRGAKTRRKEAAALDRDERSPEQSDLRSRKLGTNDNDDRKERVEYLLSRYDLGDRCAGSGAGAVLSSLSVWKFVGVEVSVWKFDVDKFTEETCSRVGGRFPLFGSYAY